MPISCDTILKTKSVRLKLCYWTTAFFEKQTNTKISNNKLEVYEWFPTKFNQYKIRPKIDSKWNLYLKIQLSLCTINGKSRRKADRNFNWNLAFLNCTKRWFSKNKHIHLSTILSPITPRPMQLLWIKQYKVTVFKKRSLTSIWDYQDNSPFLICLVYAPWFPHRVLRTQLCLLEFSVQKEMCRTTSERQNASSSF